jgi:hypothetical protein
MARVDSAIDAAMDAPSTWEIWSIVVGGAVIGSIFVLLLCLVLMVLLGWWTGVREPPALVLVAAGKIAGYFRRCLFWRATDPAPELERSQPNVAAPPGSSRPS